MLSPLKGLNLARSHKLIHRNQYYLTTETRGTIFVIEAPPKIWKPKVQNKYTPTDYAIDIDDGVFDLYFNCKTFFLPKKIWIKSQRNNLIHFTKDIHQKELQNNLRVRQELDSETCSRVTNIIIMYWYCFSK